MNEDLILSEEFILSFSLPENPLSVLIAGVDVIVVPAGDPTPEKDAEALIRIPTVVAQSTSYDVPLGELLPSGIYDVYLCSVDSAGRRGANVKFSSLLNVAIYAEGLPAPVNLTMR